MGSALNNIAGLYWAQGRYAEAEPLYRRGLAISEKVLGPEHPDVGKLLNNLAALFQHQGRYAEAEPLHRRDLAITERTLGPEHPSVGIRLNNLAERFQDQGRYAEAEPLYRRGLAISEKALGPEHPSVGASLNNLAELYHAQGRYAEAADYWRRSTGLIERRAERGQAGAAVDSSRGEAQRLGWQFSGLVRMTHRLAAPSPTAALAAEVFETAQWAQASAAATSLAQMAARSATGKPELAVLVRQRQDLIGEWQSKDKLLIATKSAEPGKRNADAEKALAGQLAGIDARLADISRLLAQDFPDYAALADSAPTSVADVQGQLGPDEALILFFDTDDRFEPLLEESFIWVVTKSDVRWVRSDLGTAALTREVVALRCGIDAAAWEGLGKALCATVLEMAPPGKTPDPLPFPHARSHALYTACSARFATSLKGSIY